MRTVFTIILTICFFSLHAQVADTASSPGKTREFKNQGELEDYMAEQFFEKNYTKQEFPKYGDEVVVNGNGFIFSNQVLVVTNTAKELRTIFSTGLFYPSIITGTVTIKPKTKEELDRMTAGQKVFYNLARTDSLTITDLQELTFLRKSTTQRRFGFWLHRKGLFNPQVCFFELTNGTATIKTDVETFIKGAVLTFYKEGWIII